MAAAPIGRYEALGGASGSKLYVLGGFFTASIDATVRCDVYDRATDTWTRLADMPEPITHAGAAFDGNYIYTAGGFVGMHPGPGTDHVWRYDIAANTWSAGVPLPAARGGGMVVRLGRMLHFFGGGIRINNVWRPDPADHWAFPLDAPNPQWVAKAPMPNPRNHLGGTVLNGKIYAIGGQHEGNEANDNQTSIHEYDPATDTWTAKANMPRPLGHIMSTVFALNNRVVVVSGVTDNTGSVANIIEFDPVANTWRELTPLLEPRHSPVAGVIDGRMVVSGGTYGPLQTTTWLSAQVLPSRAAGPVATGVQLFPNPAVAPSVEFVLDQFAAGPYRVELTDALGRVCRRYSLVAQSAAPRGSLSIHELPAGVYSAAFYQGTQVVRTRLVRQ
ncbi:Kelch repeat-containing protein [Hymenobacter busanensis]|nr:kelch repeat-containing protein [Hymenobacter busanensis]QHJ07509.1 hypothetical protein GUY19_09535 [Hymenobacter busanensis]